MTHNDVLIRLRYALDINNPKIVELFSLAGYAIERPLLEGIFKREDEDGFIDCDDRLAGLFLEGLIISRRGPPPKAAPVPRGPLTNNEILKRIRIALELKDEDLVAIMALAGVEVSKGEINALFRKKDSEKYRPCGDQFLRNFLAGLTKKYRG